MKGVDAFIIGPYDLFASLGIPGQFDHPSMIESMSEIKRVMCEHQKAAGYHVVHSDSDALKQRKEEGFTFIAYGDDMVFFSEKIADVSKELI